MGPTLFLAGLAVIAAVFGLPVLKELQLSGTDIASTGSRSAAAATFLERNPQLGNYRPLLIVVRLPASPRSPRTRDHLDRIIARVANSPGVGNVVSYRGLGVPTGAERNDRNGETLSQPLSGWERRFFSRDRKWSVIAVPQDLFSDSSLLSVATLEDRVGDIPGVHLAGPAAVTQELGDQIREDLRQAELISFPAILALLLIWFRRPLLASIPLVTGAATLCETFLVIRLLHMSGVEFSLLAAAPVAGLALGLSVDYSMLLVSRYREEHDRAGTVIPALTSATRASAPTITISATVMVFTLAPLSLFDIPIVSSLGIAAGYCAIVAAFNALTLSPLLLALYGNRLATPHRLEAWLGNPGLSYGRFWSVVPRFSARYPRRVLGAITVLLILVALPIASSRVSSLSDSATFGNSEAARMTRLLQQQFTESVGHERYVILTGNQKVTLGELSAGATALRRVQGLVTVLPAERIGRSLWKIEAEGADPIGSDASRVTVGSIEAAIPNLDPFISSPAALLVDRDKVLWRTMPVALALSLGFVLLLLFFFTGSFILPVKFLALNALTIAVSLGVVAQMSQITGGGVLDTAEVVILVVMSLALITDYGVFVLARILEEHRAGMADRDAILTGVRKTGPIVSAAASVFAVAVGAFLFSDIDMISQLSAGLVTAVLVDASIVRATLIPASMVLLGRFNWWAPPGALALRRWLVA